MSPLGRHSCIAQGGMRAKPEMKPWVYTDKSRMSSAGAALQREHLPYASEVPPLWGSSITTARNEYDVLTKVSTR